MSVEVILQAFENGVSHRDKICSLLESRSYDSFFFSVAYAKSTGVYDLFNGINLDDKSFEVYLGINNGVTSIQSILEFIKFGITPTLVDMGKTSSIFHPKLYIASDSESLRAEAIVGSANLTFNGLSQNVETSLQAELSSLELLTQVKNSFQEAILRSPENFIIADSVRRLVTLMNENKLEDERVRKTDPNRALTDTNYSKQLPAMKTLTSRRGRVSKRPSIRVSSRVTTATGAWVLCWESSPLTERSLNIPQHSGTNITGDINLVAGLMTGINFQTYFRNNVFVSEIWGTDAGSRAPHLERCHVNFEIVINGVTLGNYNLEVTHDPRTNTSSYIQRNAMTKLKWGSALTLVQDRSLLGLTLKIYKSANLYRLVID